MTQDSRRKFVLAGIISLAGILATGQSFGQFERLQRFEIERLSIKTNTGQHEFRVEIARRPKQQAQGLMFRRRMEADAGMLFIYPYSQSARIWMKNTYIPLDLLFVDGTGKIVGFHQRTVPHSLEVITSKQPASAVLELNAGTAARLQIAIGDTVLHPAFKEYN